MGAIQIKGLSREQWLAERTKGIGSSEIAGIMGINPWQSPLSVYNAKVDPQGDQPETQKTMVGNIIEPVIAHIFTKETGFKVYRDNKIRFNDKYSFLRANIDRRIDRTNDKTGITFDTPGNLEIKNTEHRTIANWDEDADGKKEAPIYYWAQVQHQLFCSGWNWGYLYFFVSGYETLSFQVKASPDFLDQMLKEAGIFWYENVLKGIPPKPRTQDEVAKLFPTSMKDKAVEAQEALANIHAEAYALNIELNEKKKTLKELKDKITVAMGDSELLIRNGELLATYKTSMSFNAEKFKKDEPKLFEDLSTRIVNAADVKDKSKELHSRFMEKTGARKFLFKSNVKVDGK